MKSHACNFSCRRDFSDELRKLLRPQQDAGIENVGTLRCAVHRNRPFSDALVLVRDLPATSVRARVGPVNTGVLDTQAEVSRRRGAPEAVRPGLAEGLRILDWQRLSRDLDAHGNAMIGSLLTRSECQRIARWYADDSLFRTRVVMGSHGFGRGEYRYFAYPLPERVAALRADLYPPLAALANRWHEELRVAARFPVAHEEFVARCRAAGQTRPTPLLLQYGAGDYNCLHQDLYGECVFPLQVAILLSQPGE